MVLEHPNDGEPERLRWQDPDNLLGSGLCPTWAPGATACGVGGGIEPDSLFRLSGTIGGAGASRARPVSDIPWLSLDTTAGSNAGGTATDVTVTFDSTGLANGVYTGNLCVDQQRSRSRPRQRDRPGDRAGDPDRPAADCGGTDRPGCWVGPDACAGWRAAGCGGCCRPEHGDGCWLRPAPPTAGIKSASQVTVPPGWFPITIGSDCHFP